MMKFALSILLVFCVIALSGCSPSITNGEMVSKSFVPEHEEDEPDMQIGDMTIPGGTYTVPDKWYVKIGKENEKGKWKERTFRVTEERFNELQKGDWVNFE